MSARPHAPSPTRRHVLAVTAAAAASTVAAAVPAVAAEAPAAVPNAGPSTDLHGAIADFRLHNRALSAAEVAALAAH
ncbi:hypothetical protein ACWGH4_22430 [Streptomyces sp. NPDC054847]